MNEVNARTENHSQFFLWLPTFRVYFFTSITKANRYHCWKQSFPPSTNFAISFISESNLPRTAFSESQLTGEKLKSQLNTICARTMYFTIKEVTAATNISFSNTFKQVKHPQNSSDSGTDFWQRLNFAESSSVKKKGKTSNPWEQFLKIARNVQTVGMFSRLK